MSRDKTTETLAQMRAQLDVVDQTLMQTAAARQALVAKIGAAKLETGGALFDRVRERQVYEKARENAEDAGLDPAVGQRLINVLVEASHRLQARQLAEGKRADVSPRHFLIIGGGGGMGSLFCGALRERGHRVSILEADDGQDPAALVPAAEVVVVCVPMDKACEVARSVGPLLNEDALLCDVNSLKSEVCQAMAEAFDGQVLGTHPMFGPSVSTLRRQKVVVCPVRPGPLTDWLPREFAQMGLEIIESDPSHHDRMMAVVQVLVHFHTIVMGEALRRTGITIEESLRFTSPIYRLELSIVGRLFAQDPGLYAEIEMTNPYGPEVIEHFSAAAQHVAKVVRDGQRQTFHETFGAVTDYFSAFSTEAMQLSDFLIDTLVARP